ncbi:MAG: transporter substrate-binding domain-containing protein [Pseudomonadota bacterium]
MITRSFKYACLIVFAGHGASASELTLMTEEYPPYNYQSENGISGFGAEQVFEIMKRADLGYEVELTRWSRAIGSARKKPATCVFSTFRTPNREADFRWIGPLSVDRALLIKRQDSDLTLNSLDDALSYSVGTQKGEFTVGILEAAGFKGIEQAATMADALKKLLVGRNDLMAVPEPYFERLQEEGVPVSSAFVLPELQVALACNPKTDPDHLSRMQQALDSMIEDGTQRAIQSRYE